MSKITEGEIMCKLWDMANELYGFANENFIEEWGIDRFAITFPDAFCEHMEMIIEDNEIEKPLAKFVNRCHWWYGRTTEDKLDKYWMRNFRMYANVPYKLDKMEVGQTIEITYKLEGFPVRKIYTMIFDTLFIHSRNQFAKWKIEQKKHLN